MPKPRRHVLDVYGIHLRLATTKTQWKRLRKELTFLDTKHPDSLGYAHFATFHPNDGSVPTPFLVLWVDASAHDPINLIETAAHEASHGAGQILDWIGHDYRGTDEPHAYLTGWLTRWVFEGCTDSK